MADEPKLPPEHTTEADRLRERLKAAEDVCVVLSWTAARFHGTREKALHELWRHWCDVSGVSLSADAHPHLSDERLEELAARRDETRARTLARIRGEDQAAIEPGGPGA